MSVEQSSVGEVRSMQDDLDSLEDQTMNRCRGVPIWICVSASGLFACVAAVCQAADPLQTMSEEITVPLDKPSAADQRFVRQNSAQEDSGIPELLEPESRAVLDNGRLDCADTWVWEFKWGEVEGAEAYELFVIGRTARVPLVKRVVDKPFYRSKNRGYIPDRRGWTWKVRAIRNGQPLPWSKTRTFDVAPVRTGPPKQDLAGAGDANRRKNKIPNQEDTLEGLWRVKGFAGHEAAPDKDPLAASSLLVDVEEDRVTFLCGAIDEDGITQWTLEILPGQTPKRFELTREGPPLPEKYVGFPDTILGTHEVVDDVLRIGLLGSVFRSLKKSFPAAVEGEALIIELVRVDTKQVETLMALQGPWKQTMRVAFGSHGQKEALVWVKGEWVVLKVLVEGKWVVQEKYGQTMPWRFRLRRTVEPEDTPAIPAPDRLGWPETTWVDYRKITLFGAGGGYEGADGFLARTADGRIVVVFPGGYVLWERATTEDLAAAEEGHAAAELKPVMSMKLLAQKKQALQQFVARYADTQAAQTARQALQQMLPDEEICEIDGAEMLKEAQERLRAGYPLDAAHRFQAVIDNYAGTRAAQTAKQELDRMPPAEEIDEIEAARMLKSAQEKLDSYYDLKQKLSLQQRKQLKASAEQQMRKIIEKYPRTKAADEARRLVDPTVQREKRAAQLLDLAKQLLPKNPEAGKRRLREIVQEFADTKEAEEAKRLLEEAK